MLHSVMCMLSMQPGRTGKGQGRHGRQCNLRMMRVLCSCAVLLTMSERESSNSCFLCNNTELMKVNNWFMPCSSDMFSKAQ